MKQFPIVGICGKPGAGKDTIGLYFKGIGFYQYALANPLKRVCAAAFDMDLVDLHGTIEQKELIDKYWGVSPRQVAQYVGTELFRTHMDGLIPGIGGDFWIRRGYLEYRRAADLAKQYSGFVITDVRFKNEADLVINNGGLLIEVVRPDFEPGVGIVGHASEAGFSKETYGDNYTRVINEGTIGDLYNVVAVKYQNFLSN